MLFESLDKLRRNSILSAILLTALGAVILLCPAELVPNLILIFGYTLVVVALVQLLNFFSSNKSLEEELDFRVEANNTKFFKEHCIEDEEKITCPTVIDELTTERIFTMTYVDGCTLSHHDQLVEDGCDLNAIGQAIVESFVHQVFDVGTFHADPHLVADSLRVLSKGKTKINIEIMGFDEPLEKIGRYVKYVMQILVACVLFIGSCILCQVDLQPKTTNDMPLISVCGIVFSIALTIYSIGKLSKK